MAGRSVEEASAVIEWIAFDLATGSRIVEPKETKAAVSDLIAAVRRHTLVEAAAAARAVPLPRESARHWHWFEFAKNRIADRITALIRTGANR